MSYLPRKNMLSEQNIQQERTNEWNYEDSFLPCTNKYAVNEGWGNDYCKKQDGYIRIYFQNINGVTNNHKWDKWQQCVQEMVMNQVDISCFVETNIQWTPGNRNKATQIVRDKYQQGVIITSQCEGFTSTMKQPGGTCMCMTGRTLGAIEEKGEDSIGLGRWSYCILRGSQGRKIAIINAYRVHKNPGTGDNTVYQQQYRILRQQQVQFPKPQQRFDDDLIQQLEQWKQKNYEIIMTIDANTELYHRDLCRILSRSGLKDALGFKHGIDRPQTHIRGTAAIDFIFATEAVIQAIQAGGMLSFNHGIQSDHRALWIDLHSLTLLRGVLPPLYYQRMFLPWKNAQWEEKAKIAITKVIRKEKVEEKISILLRDMHDMARDEIIKELELIDEYVQQAMLSGARVPRTRNVHWWTPSLKEAKLVVNYWKLRRTQHATKVSMQEGLQHILDQLPATHELQTIKLVPSINRMLRKALQNLVECKRSTYRQRNTFLDQSAANHKMIDQTQASRAVKIIHKSEITPITYRKIRNYLTNKPSGEIKYVDVPEGNDSRRVHNKADMEQCLLMQHKKHFSQAQDTPLANIEVIKRFGQASDTLYAHKFRQGDQTEISKWKNESIKEFIRKLMPEDTDPPIINSDISINNIKEGFRIWSAKTSTSPSGRKLPLYKMWLNNVENENILPEDTFLQLITNVINIAHKIEYPLRRWRVVHNLLLPKKQGVYKIDRLRPIHIIEAELNLIRRELITRRLLYNAEAFGTVPSNNYGGRSGKMANDAVMLKYFSLSTCQMQRRNFALTDCDAQACYDRILPHVLGLCYSKFGLPEHTSRWLSRALVQMEYQVITAYGVSDGKSSTDNNGQIFGIGQGATDAPTGWLLISTILSRLQNARAHGSFLYDPSYTETVSWSHVMFVDDTYLFHTATQTQATEQTLREIVQHDVRQWQDGLHISGGKLRADKSTYYSVVWDFHTDGSPFIKELVDQQIGEVHLEVEGGMAMLNRISPTNDVSGYKSLGVRMPADLDNKYELKAMQEKSDRFSAFLAACPLNRTEAYIAYRMYFIPSVAYGGISLSLTCQDIKNLQKRYIPTLLTKMGYQSSFPRALVFSPTVVGGLGVIPLNVIILQRKIQFMYRHLRIQSDIGKLLLINLRWAMLQMGQRAPPFTTSNNIAYIENTWVIQLHEELIEMSGKLLIADLHGGILQRIGDEFLMDIFTRMYLNVTTLKHLNYCRMYLKVARLSDITTNDGKYIQSQVYYGGKQNDMSNKQWPYQEKPSDDIWRIWRGALDRLCCHGRKLQYPLGQWTHIDFNPKYWYSHYYKMIIQIQFHHWVGYQTETTRREIHKGDEVGRLQPCGKLIPLVEVDTCPNCLGATKKLMQRPSTWEEREKQTWEVYKDHLQYKKAVACRPDMEFQCSNHLWIVSDGGLYGELGYYGWVIANDSKIIWEGRGRTPGHQHQLDSLRTESSGMLHALTVLAIMLPTKPLTSGRIIVSTDNKTLVNRSSACKKAVRRFPREMTKPHMDIQLQIDVILDKLYNIIDFEHVKGHQDSRKGKPLSWVEQLNVRADALATLARYHLSQKSQSPYHVHFPASKIQLYIEDQPVTKWMPELIHRARTSDEYITYVTHKLRWAQSTYKEVQWEVRGKIHQQFSSKLKPWLIKYSNDRLPLMGEKYYNSTTQLCPVCHLELETADHFKCCNHYKVDLEDIKRQMTTICQKYHIDPYLRILLYRVLEGKECRPRKITLEHPTFPLANYDTLLKSQGGIGWNNLTKGYVSVQWERHQTRYARMMKCSTNDESGVWISKIVSCYLRNVYHRWEYRNECLHEGKNSNAKDYLLTCIKGLYAHRDKVSPQDRHCFRKPLEEWKLANQHDMKQWLSTFRNHIRICVNHAKHREMTRSQDIRKWFGIREEIEKNPCSLLGNNSIASAVQRALNTQMSKLESTPKRQVTIDKFQATNNATYPKPAQVKVRKTSKTHPIAKDNPKYYIQTRIQRHMRKASYPRPVVSVPQSRHTESTIGCPVPLEQRNIKISKVVPKLGHNTGQDQNLARKKYERWKENMTEPMSSCSYTSESQTFPVETKPPSVVRD